MTVDENRVQLRSRLEELVGVSGADILLDRPPGGWSDLVTNHSLDLRFATSEERFDRRLEALEARIAAKFFAVEGRFAAVDAQFAELEHQMEMRFAAIDHRFDRFEHELLGQVDRRLRSQAWMTISTIVAVGGVIVAAIRI
jgi:glutathione S-transferase